MLESGTNFFSVYLKVQRMDEGGLVIQVSLPEGVTKENQQCDYTRCELRTAVMTNQCFKLFRYQAPYLARSCSSRLF